MVLCVEALVSPEGGDFSNKLEDQVLITEDGFENLTTYEFDRVLMGGRIATIKKSSKKVQPQLRLFTST